MKKNFDNCKVQFSLSEVNDFREIYWRIIPSELSLWNRVFNNGWKPLYHQCGDCLSQLFDIKEYNTKVKYLNTYSDVINYLNNEEKNAINEHNKFVKLNLIWDDEDIYRFIS